MFLITIKFKFKARFLFKHHITVTIEMSNLSDALKLRVNI